MFGDTAAQKIVEELHRCVAPDFLRARILQRLVWLRKWADWCDRWWARLIVPERPQGLLGELVDSLPGSRRFREALQAFLEYETWGHGARFLFPAAEEIHFDRKGGRVGGALREACATLASRVEQSGTPLGALSREALQERLALLLTHPGLVGPLPPAAVHRATDQVATDAVGTFAAMEPGSVERLLPCMEEILRIGEAFPLEELLTSDVPPDLVSRAMGCHLLEFVSRMHGDTRKIRAFLECVETEETRRNEIDPQFLVWLSREMGHKEHWEVALLLDMMSWLRDVSHDEERMFFLWRVAGALRYEDPGLVQALEAWRQPPRMPLTRAQRELAKVLGVSEETLSEFVYYRRKAGCADSLSKNLRRVLVFQRRIEAQRNHLKRRIPTLPPGSQRSLLEDRLRKLSDPAWIAGRHEKLRREARRRLLRSLRGMRLEALKAILWRSLRAKLEAKFGVRLPDRSFGEEWFGLVFLLHEEGIGPLVARFLRDLSEGMELTSWPENALWIRRARKCGVRVDRWLAGFRQEVVHEGRHYVIDTEKDPLRAMHLGTHFGTCLSLSDGLFAETAFLIAVNVNKHVVYLKDEKGVVVGRKVIGASASGRLVGYQVFLRRGLPGRLAEILDGAVLAFGRRCGLRPARSGESEEWLHGKYAPYLGDRPQPWRVRDTGQDSFEGSLWDAVILEEQCLEALRSADQRGLHQVLSDGPALLRDRAAWELLQREPGPDPAEIRRVAPSLSSFVVLSALRKGRLRWNDCWRRHRPRRAAHLGEALVGQPLAEAQGNAEELQGLIDAGGAAAAGGMFSALETMGAPPQWFVGRVEEILRLLGVLVRAGRILGWSEGKICAALARTGCLLGLQMAFVRSPDPEAILGPLWQGERALRRLLLRFLLRVKVPGSGSRLRRMLVDGRDEAGDLAALALARQEGRGAARFLQRMLVQRADSLAMAAALALASGGEGGGHWSPASLPEGWAEDAKILELLRWLQPVEVLRQLWEEIDTKAMAFGATWGGGRPRRPDLAAGLRRRGYALAVLGPLDDEWNLETLAKRLSQRYPGVEMNRVAPWCLPLADAFRELAQWERAGADLREADSVLRSWNRLLSPMPMEPEDEEDRPWVGFVRGQELPFLEHLLVSRLEHEHDEAFSQAALVLLKKGCPEGPEATVAGFLSAFHAPRVRCLPWPLLRGMVGVTLRVLLENGHRDRSGLVALLLDILDAIGPVGAREVLGELGRTLARGKTSFGYVSHAMRRLVPYRRQDCRAEALEILRTLLVPVPRLDEHAVLTGMTLALLWLDPGEAEALTGLLTARLRDQALSPRGLMQFPDMRVLFPRRTARALAREIVRRSGVGEARRVARLLSRVNGGAEEERTRWRGILVEELRRATGRGE
jgi:hypothetical protein